MNDNALYAYREDLDWLDDSNDVRPCLLLQANGKICKSIVLSEHLDQETALIVAEHWLGDKPRRALFDVGDFDCEIHNFIEVFASKMADNIVRQLCTIIYEQAGAHIDEAWVQPLRCQKRHNEPYRPVHRLLVHGNKGCFYIFLHEGECFIPPGKIENLAWDDEGIFAMKKGVSLTLVDSVDIACLVSALMRALLLPYVQNQDSWMGTVIYTADRPFFTKMKRCKARLRAYMRNLLWRYKNVFLPTFVRHIIPAALMTGKRR